MKYLLVPVVLLLVTGSGRSLDCKFCDEGTIDTGSGTYEKMTDEYNYKMPAGHIICNEDELTPQLDTCYDEFETDHVCVSTYLDYSYDVDGTTHNVKGKQYRCALQREIDEDSFCVFLRETLLGISLLGTENQVVNACEREVLVAKEEGSGEEDGGNVNDCMNEFCSGGDKLNLKFILAAANFVLHEMF